MRSGAAARTQVPRWIFGVVPMSPGDQLRNLFFDVLNSVFTTFFETIISTSFSLFFTPLIQAVLSALGIQT
jgi:hypothetical protein